MHSYRGRGGPRKPTPANVQCQKCLKRGHYSYECKVQLQERPYNPRPSRTQQLLNPKLVPKLTNDTPDDATRKKGVADEELARKEVERARKRELDDGHEPSGREPGSKRQRSSSVDSVSSISTGSSKSPPPPRRASPSPRRDQDFSPPSRRPGRSRSFGSVSDGSRRRSLTPDAQYRQHPGRHYESPEPRERPHSRRGPRGDSPETETRPHMPQNRRPSVSDDEKPAPRRQQRYDSRSPGRSDPRDRRRPEEGRYREHREYRDRDEGPGRHRGPPPEPEPPRERSLSPFSKRLALTQAMNR
ncbi:zinc knuckle-domain-containing protein [Diaporthe sp. PMI_573]|nr:zinc knuckle-domain-containing protein [Diaporthaceae sp. PMI_573]